MSMIHPNFGNMYMHQIHMFIIIKFKRQKLQNANEKNKKKTRRKIMFNILYSDPEPLSGHVDVPCQSHSVNHSSRMEEGQIVDFQI